MQRQLVEYIVLIDGDMILHPGIYQMDHINKASV